MRIFIVSALVFAAVVLTIPRENTRAHADVAEEAPIAIADDAADLRSHEVAPEPQPHGTIMNQLPDEAVRLLRPGRYDPPPESYSPPCLAPLAVKLNDEPLAQAQLGGYSIPQLIGEGAVLSLRSRGYATYAVHGSIFQSMFKGSLLPGEEIRLPLELVASGIGSLVVQGGEGDCAQAFHVSSVSSIGAR